MDILNCFSNEKSLKYIHSGVLSSSVEKQGVSIGLRFFVAKFRKLDSAAKKALAFLRKVGD